MWPPDQEKTARNQLIVWLEYTSKAMDFTWKNISEREPLGLLAFGQSLEAPTAYCFTVRNPVYGQAFILAAEKCGLNNQMVTTKVGNLQESWPVARTFFRLAEAEGACLLDLAIMPGLAPCYVATERALIVGWNPASLRKALDGRSGERDGLGDFSGAIIHLDRFGDADRILSSALSTEMRPHSTQYPWKRITAKGAPESSGFRLRLRFESGLGTS